MTETNTYKLPMSRDDWQCYLDTPQEIVDLINTNCQKVLDRCNNPESALRCIYLVLNNFEEHGLRDTECDHVAVAVVNAHFTDHPDVNRYSVGFV